MQNLKGIVHYEISFLFHQMKNITFILFELSHFLFVNCDSMCVDVINKYAEMIWKMNDKATEYRINTLLPAGWIGKIMNNNTYEIG